MFGTTVDILVSRITRLAAKLIAHAEQQTAKADKHSVLAVTAQSEAERAYRISKKIGALLS